MSTKLLLFAITAAAFCSCSSAYKTTQTPDDVYYSPARFYSDESKSERKQDYKETRNYSEERQIRLGINDSRWRYFDNDISYSPYMYGYNYGYYYNPYYYNLPVYSPILITPVNPKTSTPRTTNLAAYNTSYNNVNNNTNTKMGGFVNSPVRIYNNSNNNRSKVGNTLDKIFNSVNNGSDNNSTPAGRSYSPSSSSSSSSSGSGSSGSSSRPARSGKN